MQLPSSATLRKSGKYKIVTDRPPMQNEAIKSQGKALYKWTHKAEAGWRYKIEIGRKINIKVM